MKKIYLIIAICVVMLAGCQVANAPTQNNNEVTDFTSCVQAGNPVMESYPRQCRHQGITYVEEIDSQKEIIRCSDADRDADVCIEIYDPVCAKVNVQCVTEPCPPVEQTFSNGCKACQNQLVESYTKGACENE